MCSDSYPIPILSLFFLYHPYIPYFLILYYSLLPFLLHAFMYCHQVYNSKGGLAPKIGFSTWTMLDGYSYEQALPRYVQLIENAVVYTKCTLFTNSYVHKYLSL